MIFKENLRTSYHSLVKLNHCRTGFIYLLQDAILLNDELKKSYNI